MSLRDWQNFKFARDSHNKLVRSTIKSAILLLRLKIATVT